MSNSPCYIFFDWASRGLQSLRASAEAGLRPVQK